MTSWLTCYQARRNARLRLFCFPYAGASGAIYRGWSAKLPDWIEVCPVEAPGRWERIREAPFRRVEPLVEAAVEGLDEFFDLPFAFFGYSVGAIVAFEVARALRRTREKEPCALFLSARRAPQLVPPTLPPTICTLPDHAFAQQIATRYGSVARQIVQNADLLELVLPVLRADYEVLETYTYQTEAPFTCPVHTFGGEQDAQTPQCDLEAWQDQSTGHFQMHRFVGDHFFLNTAEDAILQLLPEVLIENCRL